MTRKTLSLITFILLISSGYSQNKSGITKFIKGNISDKTAAVREASPSEAVWLSKKAIEFTLENKSLLGNDRDLDGLAVAAVLSVSSDAVLSFDETQKQTLENQFLQLFKNFSSSNTVQIAVLTKIVSLKNCIQTNSFVLLLNEYLKSNPIQSIDSSVFKAELTALETLGNSETFIILYNFLNNPKYSEYHTEIEKTFSALIPECMNETLALIQTSNNTQLRNIYNIVLKNSKLSKNNLCEISEKVLSKSILLMDSISEVSQDDIIIQIKALQTLTQNKWTRASQTVISYFMFGKVQFTNGVLSEEQFIQIIETLYSVAPIDAVSSLTTYLEELNARTESQDVVSQTLVLSVINTLGAIGDKSAFDSLLAVTYLNYDESVLTAAREALSGLRW